MFAQLVLKNKKNLVFIFLSVLQRGFPDKGGAFGTKWGVSHKMCESFCTDRPSKVVNGVVPNNRGQDKEENVHQVMTKTGKLFDLVDFPDERQRTLATAWLPPECSTEHPITILTLLTVDVPGGRALFWEGESGEGDFLLAICGCLVQGNKGILPFLNLTDWYLAALRTHLRGRTTTQRSTKGS